MFACRSVRCKLLGVQPGEPRKLSHARRGIAGRVERAAIHPAAVTSPSSWRSSVSGTANSAFPQFQQTNTFGKTQTTPLSMPNRVTSWRSWICKIRTGISKTCKLTCLIFRAIACPAAYSCHPPLCLPTSSKLTLDARDCQRCVPGRANANSWLRGLTDFDLLPQRCVEFSYFLSVVNRQTT